MAFSEYGVLQQVIDSITMTKQLSKEEIQAKLDEYCEFKIHKIPKADITDIPVDLFIDEDRTETEVLKNGVNITEPKKLIGIKSCENECPDCKCKVKDRLVTYQYRSDPKRYWRGKCNCGLVFNPFTQEFSVKRHEAVDVYAAYERSSNPPKFDRDSSYWRFLEKKYTK